MDLKTLVPFGRGKDPLRPGLDDPFTSLRSEMERWFDDFSRRLPQGGDGGFLSPKIDVAETDAGLEVTAELPGIDRDNIQLDFQDGMLTLKAERRADRDEEDKSKRYHLVERSYGTFLRRLVVPFVADEDKIEASFEQGVLKVTVPRAAEAAQPKRTISIGGG